MVLTTMSIALVWAGCGKTTLSSNEIANIIQQAKHGDMSSVDQLISASPTPEVAKAKVQVLQCAVGAGRKDVVDQLVEADTDVRSRDESGLAAMMWAAVGDDVDMVGLLIQNGAHANDPVNALDGTALDSARSRKMVDFLVAHGADVNARDRDGGSPLHSAGTAQVTEALIDKGANVNALDRRGWTPLHMASDPDIARVLLAHGANVNAKTTSEERCGWYTIPAGTTPMGVRLIYEENGVADILRRHGGRE